MWRGWRLGLSRVFSFGMFGRAGGSLKDGGSSIRRLIDGGRIIG